MAKPSQGEPVEALYRETGRRIREARVRLKMSQQALGDRVGLNRTSITNIEKGGQRFMVHTLAAIAAELRVAPADLLPKAGAASPEKALEEIPESLLKTWIANAIDAAGTYK